jgi:hypothetical protein
MPDISMCKGSNGAYICPNRDSCYRYTAEPTPMRQSYFLTPPYDKETGKCNYHWPTGTKDEDIPKNG